MVSPSRSPGRTYAATENSTAAMIAVVQKPRLIGTSGSSVRSSLPRMEAMPQMEATMPTPWIISGNRIRGRASAALPSDVARVAPRMIAATSVTK